MLPIKRFITQGHSMQPLFNPGDKVIINRWAYLFSSPKAGDIVAIQVRSKGGKILLKKIEKDRGQRYFVIGLNTSDSTDSRSFGPIPKKQIIGKILTTY